MNTISPQFPMSDKDIVQYYNRVASELGLPRCRVLSPSRKAQLHARLKELDVATFLEAIDNLRKSRFCQGDNKRRWRADFDFVLQPKSCYRLLEGFYEDATTPDSFERALLNAIEESSSDVCEETEGELPECLRIDTAAE